MGGTACKDYKLHGRQLFRWHRRHGYHVHHLHPLVSKGSNPTVCASNTIYLQTVPGSGSKIYAKRGNVIVALWRPHQASPREFFCQHCRHRRPPEFGSSKRKTIEVRHKRALVQIKWVQHLRSRLCSRSLPSVHLCLEHVAATNLMHHTNFTSTHSSTPIVYSLIRYDRTLVHS